MVDIYSGPICKKYVHERMPTTYRPWLTGSETSWWKIAPRYVALEKTDYNSVDLHIRPVQNMSSSFPAVAACVSSQKLSPSTELYVWHDWNKLHAKWEREKEGTCNMKYNMPLPPTTTGIKSQSNQPTKEDCALWCEDNTETTAGCVQVREWRVLRNEWTHSRANTRDHSQTPFVTTKQEPDRRDFEPDRYSHPQGNHLRVDQTWLHDRCRESSQERNRSLQECSIAGDII